MAPESDRIISESDGAIARLTLNNPARRNAVSLDMWLAMGDALERFAADDAVRVIVVRGAGGKAFSAGNDISEFADKRATPEQVADYDRATARAYDLLRGAPSPTIAMIEGFCIGGGLELSQLCDIQIAAAGARFAVTPARLGIGYKLADVELLVDSVGAKTARELLFTARQVSADEALRMGLVSRVVQPAALAGTVEETAAAIAANAPLSVRAAKRIIAEAVKDAALRDRDLCQRLVDACHASEDYREGRRAFAEKRKPRFVGR